MTLVKVNNPISRSIDGFFKDFLTEFPSALSKTVREDVLYFPPVNISETQSAYRLELAAPGFEKTDFEIKLEGNLLSIQNMKKEVSTESTDKLIRKEFGYKAFKRSFTLDEKIDGENIVAKYENGILVLELPKKDIEKAGSRAISIQ